MKKIIFGIIFFIFICLAAIIAYGNLENKIIKLEEEIKNSKKKINNLKEIINKMNNEIEELKKK